MTEFHDPELRQELGRLSGPYPDDNVAFSAWQRRVGQVRRRRAMVWTTAAALSLVVSAVGAAALQSPARHSLVPSKAGEPSTEVAVRIATTEEASSTTESTSPEASEVTALASDTTADTEAIESSVPETEAPAAGGQPASGTSTKAHSPSAPSPVGAQSATHTFASIGGSITVHQDGEQLTLGSTNPAAGFHAEVDERSGARVEVTFKSDNHESQITVQLENAVMKSNVVEKSDIKSDNHDATVPADPSGGDHSGSGQGG